MALARRTGGQKLSINQHLWVHGELFYLSFLTSLRLEDQINVSEKLFNTYPILIYPCRIYDHGEHTGQLRPPRPDQMCPGANWAMFNDLGVYGVPEKVKKRER